MSEAAAHSGWSPRMLRYLEASGLVVPRRAGSGYRLYGLPELEQLRALTRLRRAYRLGLRELVFAARLRREPELRSALDAWFSGSDAAASRMPAAWVEWEQRKHERLLAA